MVPPLTPLAGVLLSIVVLLHVNGSIGTTAATIVAIIALVCFAIDLVLPYVRGAPPPPTPPA